MPEVPSGGLFDAFLSPGAILAIVTILGSAWLVIRLLTYVVESLASRFGERRLLLLRFVPLISIFVWGIATVLLVVGVMNPGSQTMAALVGASVFAIGFAGQDFVKNILGGLIILFDGPFQVGDKVEIQPYYGEIVRIGLRSTKLVTNDDSLVTVPNAKMLEQAVSNGNAGALDFQVVTDVYLPAHTDLRQAEHLAWQAAATSPYVFLDKPVVVGIADVMKERLYTRVRIRAYVLDIRLETAFQSDVSKRAKWAFMEAGLLPPHFGEHVMVGSDTEAA